MTEQTTREFLARLWQLQAARGIGNSELARRLGISPSYVRRLQTRTTIKRLGFTIALAASREFPELAPFLSADLPTSQPSVHIIKPTEEEASQ